MGCGSETKSSEAVETKQLLIEFLYLDAETCAPCEGTSDALDEAMNIVQSALEPMGIKADLRRIHVETAELAVKNQFRSSPTIRIMGRDIDPAVTEDDCPSCGALTGDAIKVDCRTWHWRGDVFQAAPVGKIIEEIMGEAAKLSAGTDGCCVETCCSDDKSAPEFTLPDNLQTFFDARAADAPLGC